MKYGDKQLATEYGLEFSYHNRKKLMQLFLKGSIRMNEYTVTFDVITNLVEDIVPAR